jgi:small-conductance mechanosensitive channel
MKTNLSLTKKKASVVKYHHWLVWFTVFMVLGILFSGVDLRAEEDAGLIKADDRALALTQSKQEALANERERLEDLKDREQRLKVWQEEFQAKLSLYETQKTDHQNLLLMGDADREDLESALQINRLATIALKGLLEDFQKSWEEGTILLNQVEDRMDLGDEQFDEIQRLDLEGTEKQKLVDLNQEFRRVLKDETKIIESYSTLYQNILTQLNDTLAELGEIGQRLKEQLSRLVNIRLFQRTFNFPTFFSMPLRSGLQKLKDRLTAPFSPTGRQALWNRLKRDDGLHLSIFLVFVIFIVIGQSKICKPLKIFEEKLTVPDWRYSKMALQLLRHSLLPASLAFLFTLCLTFNWTFFNIGLARALSYLFIVMMLTRWGLDYLKLGFQGPPTPLRNVVVPRLKNLFRLVRLAGIVFILMDWLAGTGSPLSWLPWLAFFIWLLGWTVVFWRTMDVAVAEGAREGQAAPDPQRSKIWRGWSFLVSGGALFIYIAGYYYLARYWIASWIFTAIIILWAWISYQVIKEFRQAHQALADRSDEARPLGSVDQLRWALIQIARLVWYIGFAWLIVRVWDRTGYVMQILVHFFNLTVSIGSLNISLKGVIDAGIIIFLTHLINRVGQSIIDEKMLAKKRLERGLKNSILTVVSYLTWGLGLLLAMGTLGVNATSLAVVFGAVSIGIGFGLQNIFNNFISGLILLFERPIQVGDYVEVGGLWAEVKKINVRSTVVQTFDNAAVIIPNSDFISQQVTNWSFKDARMRRHIDVGVAYGSDTELVRKTLLEIATEMSDVLKYPRPDVIFMDHADSALLFRLRIWTHVDNYYSATSAIRFELDKRFRELGIEIAFPQRDIHIRSVAKASEPVPIMEKAAE